MELRSKFSVIRDVQHILFIRDDFDPDEPTMTVTNDADNVVRWCHVHYPGRRVVYRDTEGEWAELKHNLGIFVKFAPYYGPSPAQFPGRF